MVLTLRYIRHCICCMLTKTNIVTDDGLLCRVFTLKKYQRYLLWVWLFTFIWLSFFLRCNLVPCVHSFGSNIFLPSFVKTSHIVLIPVWICDVIMQESYCTFLVMSFTIFHNNRDCTLPIRLLVALTLMLTSLRRYHYLTRLKYLTYVHSLW